MRVKFPPRKPAARWKATCQDRDTVLRHLLAPPFALENPVGQRPRRLGLTRMLDWLQVQPGRTWQERWKASAAATGGRADPRWMEPAIAWLKDTDRIPPETTSLHAFLVPGLVPLICGDVIRPSLPWLLTVRRPVNLVSEMARIRDPGGFAALEDAGRGSVVSDVTTVGALARIVFIMAAKGGTVGDITVGDCLELLDTAAGYGLHRFGGNGPYFYQLLHAIGVFSADGPPTVRMLNPGYQGQATPEQLIDRYDLACRPVRDLLVDYLRERQPRPRLHQPHHLGVPPWAAVLEGPRAASPRDRLTGSGSGGGRGVEAAHPDQTHRGQRGGQGSPLCISGLPARSPGFLP